MVNQTQGIDALSDPPPKTAARASAHWGPGGLLPILAVALMVALPSKAQATVVSTTLTYRGDAQWNTIIGEFTGFNGLPEPPVYWLVSVWVFQGGNLVLAQASAVGAHTVTACPWHANTIPLRYGTCEVVYDHSFSGISSDNGVALVLWQPFFPNNTLDQSGANAIGRYIVLGESPFFSLGGWYEDPTWWRIYGGFVGFQSTWFNNLPNTIKQSFTGPFGVCFTQCTCWGGAGGSQTCDGSPCGTTNCPAQ